MTSKAVAENWEIGNQELELNLVFVNFFISNRLQDFGINYLIPETDLNKTGLDRFRHRFFKDEHKCKMASVEIKGWYL